MNPLLQLKRLGQSVWYDNLRRGLMTSGELKRMIEEYGLAGITSNPTIFDKAITGTSEYDPEIERLAGEGLDVEDILKEIFVEDIRLAADAFDPVYGETGGRDGFVSIEVRPAYAHDTEKTISEAKGLFTLINRPNIMVKVPGTEEGAPAVEELTYQGYNINITLLFSVAMYEKVAWAYIRGLERRAAEGKPIGNISSVASFFVSRVDTLADKVIEGMINTSSTNDGRARLKNLIGKAAIANAKLAYVRFKEIFGGERFKRLKGKGAFEQRLLWASTSTKDPGFPDVKYVEALIHEGTIDTMPLQTLLAFYDHGKAEPTLAEDLDGARRVMEELAGLGIDYDKITKTLEEEGIRSFAKSFENLMESVQARKKAILEKKGYAVKYYLNGFDVRIEEAIRAVEQESFLKRLWAKDPTLWKNTPDHKKIIKNALGWLDLPDLMDEHKDAVIKFAEEVRKEGFKHAVLMGMGGSSLAPLVFERTFETAKGYPELIVLDSTDPDAIKAVEERIDLKKTLFIVSSKSGSTIEPLNLFEYFYSRLKEAGAVEPGGNFIAITDPGTPLESFYGKYGFRKVFLNPPDIGGRFSALSYFGLVPAAVKGIDISKLLYNATRISVAIHPCMQTPDNQVIRLGVALGTFGKAGRDKITFFLPDKISTFGLWLEQLIAESTGKEGKGLVPITGEPIGPPESYSDDRVFVNIGIGAGSAMSGMLKAIAGAGHPVVDQNIEDVYELGGEFLRWEVATAVAGQILGIDPFDQPDVEMAKKNTIARLDAIGKGGALTPPGVGLDAKRFKVYFGRSTYDKIKADSDPSKTMKEFMRLVHKGDYLGVLAYFNPEDTELERSLAGLRKVLRDATKAATQFGWGPRYLHSTGQLHKGGARKGVFIILCHQGSGEVRVPGRRFSFSELELSQAFGDMEALDSKGCRVALFDLGDSGMESVREAESFIINAVHQ